MTRVAMMMVVALGLWQCNGDEDTIVVADCPAALTAFKDNIQPHVKEASCDASGCHASADEDGGFALKTDTAQAQSNRKNMRGEVEEHGLLDADKLWTYLSGGDHPGSTSLGGLDKAKVTAWVTAEKTCP